jgi:hypothetical protein
VEASPGRGSALILCGVLALGAFLRLHGLSDAPAWYGDEFAHLELARNLLDGEARVGAFRVDWFGTIAHPPLFFLLGSLSVAAFGDSIAALRAVTALAGVAGIALLYLAGSMLRGRCAGLLAASAYAVMPIAVVLDRRAYAYPLVFPLALGVAVGMMHFCRFRERRSLYAAAAAMSCLLVTGHYTLPLLGVFAAYVLIYDRPHAPRLLAITAVLPLLVVALFTLPRWEPALFTFQWEMERATSQTATLVAMLTHGLQLTSRDALLGVAVLGVLSLRGAGVAWLTAVFLSVSMFLLYRRPDIASILYPTGAFLGFFALPFACLFVAARDLGLRASGRLDGGARTLARACVFGVTLGLPTLLLCAKLLQIAPDVWQGRIATPVDVWAERAEDVEATRAFLASRVAPDDLVAGSLTISHGVPARRTDLMQAYVYETGRGTAFYPTYLPGLPGYREQVFAFDCSLDEVDYLVLSRVDWRWTLRRSFAHELLGTNARTLRAEWRRQRRRGADAALTLRGEAWPVLHEAGDVLVLGNPARASRS